MFERGALARIVPFAIYIGFVFLVDVLKWLGWDVHALRHLYAIKIACVVLALLYFRRSYTELARPAPGTAAMPMALLAGLLVFIIWISLDAGWMQVGKSDGFDPRHDGVIDWWLAGGRLAGAALVVPLMEELFWRSFVMRSGTSFAFLQNDPRKVTLRIIVIEVTLFGFEHNLWLAGIVAGIIYSGLYMRTRTLWTPIIAHGVTNGALGGWVLLTGNWSYW